MAKIEFRFDPEFKNNIYRASNKQGSSLRPLYDQVRAVTDSISSNARTMMLGEWIRVESEAQALRDERTHGDQKNDWLYAKAKSFALRSAYNSTIPTMEFDGTQILGRVTINRRGSAMIEFGGPDPVAEVGRDSGQYVNHPPYSFLRNAIGKAG